MVTRCQRNWKQLSRNNPPSRRGFHRRFRSCDSYRTFPFRLMKPRPPAFLQFQQTPLQRRLEDVNHAASRERVTAEHETIVKIRSTGFVPRRPRTCDGGETPVIKLHEVKKRR